MTLTKACAIVTEDSVRECDTFGRASSLRPVLLRLFREKVRDRQEPRQVHAVRDYSLTSSGPEDQGGEKFRNVATRGSREEEGRTA